MAPGSSNATRSRGRRRGGSRPWRSPGPRRRACRGPGASTRRGATLPAPPSAASDRSTRSSSTMPTPACSRSSTRAGARTTSSTSRTPPGESSGATTSSSAMRIPWFRSSALQPGRMVARRSERRAEEPAAEPPGLSPAGRRHRRVRAPLSHGPRRHGRRLPRVAAVPRAAGRAQGALRRRGSEGGVALRARDPRPRPGRAPEPGQDLHLRFGRRAVVLRHGGASREPTSRACATSSRGAPRRTSAHRTGSAPSRAPISRRGRARSRSSDGSDTASHAGRDGPGGPRLPAACPGRRRAKIAAAYLHQAVEAVRQVAGAAHALHEAGIVHRDIKPGNIVLTAEGSHAVLMDLGLAQLADDAQGRLTRTRQFVGTLRYASPEQVLAAGSLDRRSDVYCLGATLWELAHAPAALRRRRRDAEPRADARRSSREDPARARKRNPRIDADLDAIVTKCLEKSPARRYASAADLADDLGAGSAASPCARSRRRGYLLGKLARKHRGASGRGGGCSSLPSSASRDLSVTPHPRGPPAERAGALRPLHVLRPPGDEGARHGRSAPLVRRGGLGPARRPGAGARRAARVSGAGTLRWRCPSAHSPSKEKSAALVFHPEGTHFLALGAKVPLRDLGPPGGRRSAPPGRRARGHRGGVESRGATGSSSGARGLRDLRVPGRGEVHRFEGLSSPNALAFRPDGRLLALASDNVRLWDCEQKAFLGEPIRAPEAGALALVQPGRRPSPHAPPPITSPGSTRLRRTVARGSCSSRSPTSSRLRDRGTHAPSGCPGIRSSSGDWPRAHHRDHADGGHLVGRGVAHGEASDPGRRPTRGLVASPDGQRLAIMNFDMCQVWNLAAERPEGQQLSPTGGHPLAAWRPDGSALLLTGGDRRILQWTFLARSHACSISQLEPRPSVSISHQAQLRVMGSSASGENLVTAEDRWPRAPLAARPRRRSGGFGSPTKPRNGVLTGNTSSLDLTPSTAAPARIRVYTLPERESAGAWIEPEGFLESAKFAPDGANGSSP